MSTVIHNHSPFMNRIGTRRITIFLRYLIFITQEFTSHRKHSTQYVVDVTKRCRTEHIVLLEYCLPTPSLLQPFSQILSVPGTSQGSEKINEHGCHELEDHDFKVTKTLVFSIFSFLFLAIIHGVNDDIENISHVKTLIHNLSNQTK